MRHDHAKSAFRTELGRREEAVAAERSIKKFPAGTDAQTLLRLGGLKATKPRLALAEFLFESKGPMSAADIRARLGSKGGQATLYRALEQLVAAGLVTEVKHPKHTHSLFELAYGRPHHHHAVCTSCGDVEDILSCDARDLEASTRAHLKKFKSIESHSLEFFGLCRKCEAK